MSENTDPNVGKTFVHKQFGATHRIIERMPKFNFGHAGVHDAYVFERLDHGSQCIRPVEKLAEEFEPAAE